MDVLKMTRVLEVARPNGGWVCTVDGVIYDDGVLPVKDDEIAATLKTIAANQYRTLRSAEYPPIGDQLDALWSGGVDAIAMKSQIDAVKAKYPKG